jgi:hypothetical protein
MYMGLAISLVDDLGLDREVPNELDLNALSNQGLVKDGAFTATAKRAYLGCYYLSAA